MRRTRAFVLSLSVLSASFNLIGAAADELAPGVEHQTISGIGPEIINIARIKPDAAVELSVLEAPTLRRTSDACRQVNCLIAINGDYFELKTGLRLTNLLEVVIHSWQTIAASPSTPVTISEPVGNKILVQDGQTVSLPNDSPRPRTMVGLSCQDRSLMLVTADGDNPGYSRGLSLNQAAEMMQQQGACQAINLDGGASTTFVVRGRVVNRPSKAAEPGEVVGRGERPVKTVLAVIAKPLPPSTSTTRITKTAVAPKSRPKPRPLTLKPGPPVELPTRVDFKRLASDKPRPRTKPLVPLSLLAFGMFVAVYELQRLAVKREWLTGPY